MVSRIAESAKFLGRLNIEAAVMPTLTADTMWSIASQGGRPVIADIRIDAAENVARQINDELESDRVSAVEIDITSKASLQKAIHHVHSKFGQIDALVNNA